MPVLLVILDSDDQAVRAQAARALVAFGVDAKPALPKLIEALGAESIPVRVGAAKAISGIGREAKAAVDPLTRTAENSTDADELLAAAAALAAIGPDAKVALPVLKQLTHKFSIPNFDRMMGMSIQSLENSK